jgi:hypothetical protein
LKQKVSSIFQYQDHWYGVTFEAQGRKLEDFSVYKDKSLEELKDICKSSTFGVSLSSSVGYLVGLRFPFGGTRKIGMVINNELEELLPFPLDEMALDFEESGKGNVLAAAVPKSLADPAAWGKQVRSVTVNAFAAAHGLKWLHATPHHRFLVIYAEGNTVVIMAYDDNTLRSLRQFFHAGEARIVKEAIRDMKDGAESPPEAYYLIGGDGDSSGLFAEIAKELNIRIEAPSLRRYMNAGDDTPQYFWIGVGSALLAMSPRQGINFLRGTRSGFSVTNRFVLYAMAGLAGASVIVSAMAYVDLYLQNRTYKYLNDEQGRIYREAFPNAPPIKDVAKMFEDKIMALERETTVSGPHSGLSPLGILAEVSGKLDNQIDVKLSEYTWDETEFSVTGTTVSFSAAEKIKTALEQIRGVKSIEIQNLDLSGARQVNLKMRGKF